MHDYGNQIYHSNHNRLSSKLLPLRNQQRPDLPPKPTQYKLDAVLNLSSRQLSDIEIRVLSLGPKFRLSLPDLPLTQHMLAIDSMQAMPKALCGRNKAPNLNQNKRRTKRSSVGKTPSQQKVLWRKWLWIGSTFQRHKASVQLPSDKGSWPGTHWEITSEGN